MEPVILIVDDSPTICEAFKGFLKQSSKEVSVYVRNSADEAIAFVQKHHVDIIILDIVMPYKSGEEVLKWLNDHDRSDQIYVIVCSALSNQHHLRKYFDLGAGDFMSKPVYEEVFTVRIENALHRLKQSRDILQLSEGLREQQERIETQEAQLKMSQALVASQEQLASIGQLAAGVAHEINNPMGFILSNTRVLKDYFKKIESWVDAVKALESQMDAELPALESDYSRLAELHQEVKNASKSGDLGFVFLDTPDLLRDSLEGLERVSKIVQSLRQFTRMDHKPIFELYNLNQGIENALIITKNELKNSVHVEAVYGKIPDVLALGGAINQTLLNVILNAAHAIKERESGEMGLIEISSFMESNFVCCVVKDNGMGIKEKDLAEIFKPFFTTKPVGIGTGLGLSISYDIIVNKHKGVLDVHSIYGVGTTLTIKLPVKR